MGLKIIISIHTGVSLRSTPAYAHVAPIGANTLLAHMVSPLFMLWSPLAGHFCDELFIVDEVFQLIVNLLASWILGSEHNVR